MPELPEVETVARRLNEVAAGAVLERIVINDKKIALSGRKVLNGAALRRVYRAGKTVALEFDAGGSMPLLQIHLRMTGRLFWIEKGADIVHTFDGYVNAVKGVGRKHCRARFYFDTGSLLFVDPRRFGTIKIAADESDLDIPGADPSTAAFTLAVFRELLADSSQNIKLWLLRQDKITGLGNIYASEILFDAGVHPERPVNSLTSDEIKRLHRAIKKILRSAIKHCGTTFSDFQSSEGSLGEYQNYLKVYGRAGCGCSDCGAEITRLVQGQRSTFYCPDCQV